MPETNFRENQQMELTTTLAGAEIEVNSFQLFTDFIFQIREDLEDDESGDYPSPLELYVSTGLKLIIDRIPQLSFGSASLYTIQIESGDAIFNPHSRNHPLPESQTHYFDEDAYGLRVCHYNREAGHHLQTIINTMPAHYSHTLNMQSTVGMIPSNAVAAVRLTFEVVNKLRSSHDISREWMSADFPRHQFTNFRTVSMRVHNMHHGSLELQGFGKTGSLIEISETYRFNQHCRCGPGLPDSDQCKPWELVSRTTSFSTTESTQDDFWGVWSTHIKTDSFGARKIWSTGRFNQRYLNYFRGFDVPDRSWNPRCEWNGMLDDLERRARRLVGGKVSVWE